VFKIIKETIAALQRAEARIKSTKNGTDPDLFMMKNLLIMKNELVSLEIGDVRPNGAAAPGFTGAAGGIQHFGQIWDALSPQGLMGLLSSIGSYIPLPSMPSVPSSLWNLSSRGGTPTPTPSQASGTHANGMKRANSGATTTGTISGILGGGSVPENQDASELLDELLRQSIYAFTHRWATLLSEARGGARGGTSKQPQLGGRNLVKIERDLEEMLNHAFSSQPEVVAKLKEAIQINAQAQMDAAREKEKGSSRVSRV
jgi:conserved oligomeric Golgi complex subunit 3